jgi:crossover junction endodeoxyribonuclease RuvC
MRIIGLDPGLATVGFAVVEGTKTNPTILEYGIVQTKPLAEEFVQIRLLEIGRDLEELILKYRPTKAVVESLFFYNNQKTAINVAMVRGVLLFVLTKYHVEIANLTPLQLKQIVCGYGQANKKQIQTMVQKLFHLSELPKPDDAADSLGLAWCGLN